MQGILVKHLLVRGQRTNPINIQESSISVKLLWISWWGHVKTFLAGWGISCCLWSLLLLKRSMEVTYSSLGCLNHLPSHPKSCCFWMGSYRCFR
jgi:hypothetical protein